MTATVTIALLLAASAAVVVCELDLYGTPTDCTEDDFVGSLINIDNLAILEERVLFNSFFGDITFTREITSPLTGRVVVTSYLSGKDEGSQIVDESTDDLCTELLLDGGNPQGPILEAIGIHTLYTCPIPEGDYNLDEVRLDQTKLRDFTDAYVYLIEITLESNDAQGCILLNARGVNTSALTLAGTKIDPNA